MHLSKIKPSAIPVYITEAKPHHAATSIRQKVLKVGIRIELEYGSVVPVDIRSRDPPQRMFVPGGKCFSPGVGVLLHPGSATVTFNIVNIVKIIEGFSLSC